MKKTLENNEPSSKEASFTFQARQQREERLRKRVIELGEDPDVLVAITEKDRLNPKHSAGDVRMCEYTIELEDDPHEHMDMTVRERLIGEEIIHHRLEEKGVTFSWLDTDEEWKKTVSILQENGMLW